MDSAGKSPAPTFACRKSSYLPLCLLHAGAFRNVLNAKRAGVADGPGATSPDAREGASGSLQRVQSGTDDTPAECKRLRAGRAATGLEAVENRRAWQCREANASPKGLPPERAAEKIGRLMAMPCFPAPCLAGRASARPLPFSEKEHAMRDPRHPAASAGPVAFTIR